MEQNKLDTMFVNIRNKQVVLDMDAAVLFGVGVDAITKTVKDNPERFPSSFLITLTEEEKQQVDAKTSSYAFTEAGILMLATLLDSEKAKNVAKEIIEAFTEKQQLIRHILSIEDIGEDAKKKEEAYMEDKLKHIFVRSSHCL